MVTSPQSEMFESIFGGGESSVPTQDALAKAKIPIGFRDNCANLLIPLNKVCIDRLIPSTHAQLSSVAQKLYICHTSAKTNDIATKNVNTRSRAMRLGPSIHLADSSSFKKRVKEFEAQSA